MLTICNDGIFITSRDGDLIVIPFSTLHMMMPIIPDKYIEFEQNLPDGTKETWVTWDYRTKKAMAADAAKVTEAWTAWTIRQLGGKYEPVHSENTDQ